MIENLDLNVKCRRLTKMSAKYLENTYGRYF